MRMLRIVSQLGKISSDYSGKAAQTQSSTQILLIQTSRSALKCFKLVPSLWISLCTLLSRLRVNGIIWDFQTNINQFEMRRFFFFFLRKLRWTWRQRQTKKKIKAKTKKPQQFQTVQTHTTQQSATKIQVRYTMSVTDRGGTTGKWEDEEHPERGAPES